MGRRPKDFCHITTGDFDAERYPIPPKPVKFPSPVGACVHTPCPETYHAGYEWAEQAMKTHRQVRCPTCGLWAIWLPKAQAKHVNREWEKESRRVSRAYQKYFEQRARAEGRRLSVSPPPAQENRDG